MSQIRSSRPFSIAAILAIIATLVSLPAVPAGADQRHEPRPDIVIKTDFDFNADHGVRSGSGTVSDPFVISGWNVNNLRISNTNSYVVIADNIVRSGMVLNWIGDRVHVFGNTVHDLRVNQNVRRTGESTSGMIHDNYFDVVGQLRHWDGIFENNTVGRESNDPMRRVFRFRAVNFDGFNGARFRNNTIYGYMDARLHGHHHSSEFGGGSHYHGESAQGHSEMLDHSQRYHEVWITGNTIHAEGGYGLAYLDTGHAGNDRTNGGSERDEALNGRHVHYTRVHIEDNTLVGAGININTFNANDQNHTSTAPGLVEIERNEITLMDSDLYPWSSANGISASTAKDITLRVIDNRIGFAEREFDPLALQASMDRAAGINLSGFDLGTIYLYGNSVSDRYYGVRAARFSETVRWFVDDLETSGVEESVYWDSSVHNPPEQGEG